jgi:hypothetical protein
MFRLRKEIATIVAVTFLATAAAAQTQSQPAPKSAPSSKMEDISKWTQTQWQANDQVGQLPKASGRSKAVRSGKLAISL